MAGAGTGKKQQLSCPECSKVFKVESELLAHVLNHPEEENFFCELCEEKFDPKEQLFEHSVAHKEGILVVPKPGLNVEEKALPIEDDNLKKGIGITGLCVPKADHQLVEPLLNNKELKASKKHFFTSIGQEVPLAIDNGSEGEVYADGFLTNAAIKDLQAPNDASERTSFKIVKRILPKGVTFISGEKFERKDDIETRAHSVDVSHICGICHEQFSERAKLEKHFLTHTKEECQISTSSVEVLKKCIKRGSFNRKTRPISFLKKRPLQSHSPTHRESMPYVCRICSKRFKGKQQLEQHSLIHTKNKYLCQMCFESFETRCQLNSHFVTHVTKIEAPFACRVCSKRYPSERQLQKHFHMHTEVDTHKCQVCDKVFAKRSYLVNHMGYHTRPHVCDVCGTSFPQKSFLRLHKFAHSQGFETEDHMQSVARCQSVSNEEKECSRPLKAIVEPTPSKSISSCEICHKVVSTKKELLDHCLRHGGENFACGVCGKSCSNAANLRSHFGTHGDKKFSCLVCDKKFPQKQQLISHSITHSREKKFFCGTCGKAFKRKGNLKLHNCLSPKDDTEYCIERINKIL